MHSPSAPALTIVALGASAGGLDALRGFFAATPADPRFAFVVITHLSPQHASRLAEVLQRSATMPVREARDGERVQPAHVYVIPPNRLLGIRDGSLQMQDAPPRPAIPHPIDHFMTALAEDRQEHSVGIVLSGVDHDGTVGLKEIKAVGGLTLVQQPSSAQFPGMPSSAIEAGVADAVVTVDKMAGLLADYLAHAPDAGSAEQSGPPPPAAVDAARAPDAVHAAIDAGLAARLGQVLAVIRDCGGPDFGWYRPAMLMRRIRRRMGLKSVADADAYLALLQESEVERHALVKDFLISVTQFFRQPDAWQTFAQQVLPPLFDAPNASAGIRVWTPGCATGEESLSIAMLLLEERSARGSTVPLNVFATDIDLEALRSARAGLYPPSIVDELTPARLARFFERRGDRYAVGKELREVVLYAPQDMVRDPPFSRLDLVICRNVLIYLDPAQQGRLIEAFHFALNPDGVLFLGKSESLGAHEALFQPISREHRLFRRVGSSTRLPRLFGGTWSGPGGFLTPLANDWHDQRLDLADRVRQQLGARAAAATVLVSRDHRVLYSMGETANFLQPSGDAAWDLLSLLRSGPRTGLRATLKQAISSGEAATVDTQVSRNGKFHPVRIRVEPMDDFARSGQLLVLFDDGRIEPAGAAPREGEAPAEAELRQLRAELAAAERHSENDNAELRVAHEEAMSLNEELQSSNEELQTSKEELQSMNEELGTVNAELENKVVELDRALDDLRNVIENTHVATLILDRALEIRRFTQEATRLYRLIPSDIGRPLRDLVGNADDPALLSDAAAVLADLQPREREVATSDGHWFLRRVQAFRDRDDRIDGVVITHTEITALRQAAEDARRLAAVLRDANDAVIGYDFEGRLLFWNSAAVQAYGYTQEDALAMNIAALEPADAAGDALRLAVQARDGGAAAQVMTRRRTRAGSVLEVSVTASVLRDDLGAPSAVLTTERDVTQWLRQEAELRFRAMADDIPTLIRIEDAHGDSRFLNRAWLAYTGETTGEALMARGWLKYIHPDDLSAYQQGVAESRRHWARYEGDLRLRRHDGSYRWMRMTAVARREAPGKPCGYVSVAVDIEERKRAELALAGESERKDQFLAMLAHELRNPLHPIANAAAVIQQFRPADPHVAWAGQVIARQVQQLARLVDDLMDVARIARGKVLLQLAPVELSVLVSRARDQVQPTFDARRQRLVVSMPAQPVHVEGDLVRLTQIVVNLLDNASKYSEPDTETRLEITADDEVVISVIDQGTGISAAMLPHVFELFSQEDRSLDRSQGGLGIGLSLVARLVRLHGGRVQAASAGRGHGSVFTVRLPRLQLPDAGPAPARAAAVTGSERRVLVVDDNDDGARTIALLLEHAGHQVRIAHDGRAALAIAQQYRPDVVLLDIALAGESGYDVARRLRGTAAGADALLIAMTGLDQPGDVAEAIAAGFDHHLVKPPSLDRLLAMVAAPRTPR